MAKNLTPAQQALLNRIAAELECLSLSFQDGDTGRDMADRAAELWREMIAQGLANSDEPCSDAEHLDNALEDQRIASEEGVR